MQNASAIEFRDYCDEDLWLTEALECDSLVMHDLGGPTARETVQQHHRRRLNSVLEKAVWYLTIRPDPDAQPVGTIGIWQADWQGAKINEMGWMLLPAFHGRGLATAAGRLLLYRARDERRYRQVHAFPSVSNGASNAICRKLGFTLLGECEIAYNGPPRPSHHWQIDLWNESA